MISLAAAPLPVVVALWVGQVRPSAPCAVVLGTAHQVLREREHTISLPPLLDSPSFLVGDQWTSALEHFLSESSARLEKSQKGVGQTIRDWDARSSSGTDGWRRRDWKQFASSVRETLIRLFNTVEQQAADMMLQELEEHAASGLSLRSGARTSRSGLREGRAARRVQDVEEPLILQRRQSRSASSSEWRSARGVDVLGVAMFREVTMMKAEFQQAASGCQRCGASAGGGSWGRLR